MSIRYRLAATFTLLGVVFLAVFGGVMYLLYSNIIFAQLDELLMLETIHLSGYVYEDKLGYLKIQPLPSDIHRETKDKLIIQVWNKNNRLIYQNQMVIGLQPLAPDGLNAQAMQFSTTYNGRFRVLSRPIYYAKSHIGTLQIGYDLTVFSLTENSLIREMVLFTIFAVLIASSLIYLVVNREIRRIINITDTVKSINDADDPSLRIEDAGPQGDEIGELAIAFNHTMSRLENILISQRRFLADVSHELRTPMTIIKGNVDLMRRFGEFDEESLNTIETQTDRLTRMVTSLLLLEQVETGRVEIKKTPVNMADLLLEVYQELVLISEYREQRMQIEEIDLVIVAGNRDQLKQVLLNLISNAINYTPDGGDIYLALKKDETSVIITIKDSGPGIPEEDLPYLFERFYRGEKSRTKQASQISGFGLGLSIAYWIVRNHNGTIKVNTAPGEGTEFVVRLPLTGAGIT
jgi:two-component system, OmpR family, sensor kinase